jgi:hypothetical protein
MDQNQPAPQTGAKCSTCSCVHHKTVPALIVLLGLLFLLEAFSVFSAKVVGIVWPILLILIGLQKMFGHCCKCCSK